jgi:hypothetical protein|tara:strand:+ start:435 stop:734 length:300 start_codon:yes stop_codon:yes gene_type:complete
MLGKSKYYFDTERNKPYKKDERIPSYYIGLDGLECRKVIDSFEMSYHIGSCCKYICRLSGTNIKHNDNGLSDLKKAIAHLTMELERIKKYKTRGSDNLV